MDINTNDIELIVKQVISSMNASAPAATAAPAAPKEDDFERNFKFRDLKFGADFDIKNEK